MRALFICSPVITSGGSPGLVGAGEDYAAVGGFAGEDAAAFLFGSVVGDAADGGLGEFFNLLFGLGGAVPVAEEESALLDFGAEVVPSVDGAGVGLAEVGGAFQQVVLDVVHELEDVVGDTLDGHSNLLQGVAAADLASAVLQVAGADGETHGHALELVFGELPAGFVLGAVVVFDREAFGLERVDKGSDVGVEFGHLVVGLADGDDGHLDGRQLGRQDEAVVVAVGHDEGTHQSCGDAP